MKRFATKSLVMTAALAAFAIGASAQSMTAEIPFTFRVGDAVLAAGSYRVNVGSGDHSIVKVTNADTKKAVLITPQYRRDAEKNWDRGDPKLLFACSGANCVLIAVWNGADPTALVVGSPARAGKEIAEMRVINMTTVKSE